MVQWSLGSSHLSVCEFSSAADDQRDRSHRTSHPLTLLLSSRSPPNTNPLNHRLSSAALPSLLELFVLEENVWERQRDVAITTDMLFEENKAPLLTAGGRQQYRPIKAFDLLCESNLYVWSQITAETHHRKPWRNEKEGDKQTDWEWYSKTSYLGRFADREKLFYSW